MPLISCPACDHMISIEAKVCPKCGQPNRHAEEVVDGPLCYACGKAATTRCQDCGKLSCPRHLRPTVSPHAGAMTQSKLLCDTCRCTARQQWFVIAGLAVIAMIVAVASVLMRS